MPRSPGTGRGAAPEAASPAGDGPREDALAGGTASPVEGKLRLFVVGAERFSSVHLPLHGTALIGRDPGCAVRLDEPSVQPRHAALITGGRPRLEALAGETRVSGRSLAPGEVVELATGDLVYVGSILLMLEGRPNAPPRRFLPHDYFELRLEEECHRAERHQLQFTLLRLVCGAGTPAEAVEETLADSIRLLDVVASYGPDEYEVLLIETSPEAAAVVVQRLQERLESRRAEPRIGVVAFPRDGRSADALIDAAQEAARGASDDASQPGERGLRSIPLPAVGPMQGLSQMLDRVAPSDLSVLVFGETGVGKERLAEAVHRRSKRADKPFLVLNCAALAESLLESELFGHERGAFTGAVAAKPGLLETAQGGTVFLDEIGELPMSVQVKLLRVLEERKVLRVGALKARPIDVRFVAATNRDLEAEVARGTFRRDLFYRLNGVSLFVPPLRERIAEIAPLARGFIAEACKRLGRLREPALGPEVRGMLEGYPWPGNVRELRNVCERAVLLCGDGPLLPLHLPEAKLGAPFASRRAVWSPRGPGPLATPPQGVAPVEPAPQARLPGAPQPPPSLKGEVEALEKARVAEALQACAGNQTEAARRLGMPRRTLVKRLADWGFPRPRKQGQ
jgi:DNA-binding NtrC family response regulator